MGKVLGYDESSKRSGFLGKLFDKVGVGLRKLKGADKRKDPDVIQIHSINGQLDPINNSICPDSSAASSSLKPVATVVGHAQSRTVKDQARPDAFTGLAAPVDKPQHIRVAQRPVDIDVQAVQDDCVQEFEDMQLPFSVFTSLPGRMRVGAALPPFTFTSVPGRLENGGGNDEQCYSRRSLEQVLLSSPNSSVPACSPGSWGSAADSSSGSIGNSKFRVHSNLKLEGPVDEAILQNCNMLDGLQRSPKGSHKARRASDDSAFPFLLGSLTTPCAHSSARRASFDCNVLEQLPEDFTSPWHPPTIDDPAAPVVPAPKSPLPLSSPTSPTYTTIGVKRNSMHQLAPNSCSVTWGGPAAAVCTAAAPSKSDPRSHISLLRSAAEAQSPCSSSLGGPRPITQGTCAYWAAPPGTQSDGGGRCRHSSLDVSALAAAGAAKPAVSSRRRSAQLPESHPHHVSFMSDVLTAPPPTPLLASTGQRHLHLGVRDLLCTPPVPVRPASCRDEQDLWAVPANSSTAALTPLCGAGSRGSSRGSSPRQCSLSPRSCPPGDEEIEMCWEAGIRSLDVGINF